jgi:RCC1 and BTB domain-containing protein
LISDKGKVFVWGWNEKGQLGLGHKEHQHVPVALDALSEHTITSIACGSNHSLALSSEHFVFLFFVLCCAFFSLVLTAFCLISLFSFFFSLSAKGQLFAWGYNTCGQLGIGNKEDQLSPVAVSMEEA